MIRITVYSGAGCKRCSKLKELLDNLGVKFVELDANAARELHEGWREDGSTDFMTQATLMGTELPIVRVDDTFYTAEAARDPRSPLFVAAMESVYGPAVRTPAGVEWVARLVATAPKLEADVMGAAVSGGFRCPCDSSKTCMSDRCIQEIKTSGECGCAGASKTEHTPVDAPVSAQ